MRKFLIALFKTGGHISYGIASATGNVLLNRREDASLKNIEKHQCGDGGLEGHRFRR